MDFRIAPWTDDLLELKRSSPRRLPKELSLGRATTLQQLMDVLSSVEGVQAKSVPSRPATGKSLRIDLRPQSKSSKSQRPSTQQRHDEYATIIIPRCPKPDGLVNPVIIQDGTPILAAKLAFALAAATGPVVLDGREFYGVHVVWDSRDFVDVLGEIAACLENTITEEEFTNEEELHAQLYQLKLAGGGQRSKRAGKKRPQATSSLQPASPWKAQVASHVSLELPEWRAVLNEVLREPSDDAPRQAAADWLQKHGHSDRAEFVRTQIEHARLKVPHPCEKAKKRFLVSCGLAKCEQCTASLLAQNRSVELYQRAARLLEANSHHRMWCGFSVPSRIWQVDYERGFVDKVRLPLADFETQAEAIFRVEPVTSVVLHFTMPKQVVVPKDQGRPSIVEVWVRMTSRPTRRTSNTNQLPVFLFDRLPGATGFDQLEFPGDGSAAEALNQACIDYGRELAGLSHYNLQQRRIGQ